MTRTDESALIALSLEYADAVRARDEQRWAATWTEDAQWLLDDDRAVAGRDAIVAMWATSLAKYRTVVQMYLACTYDITSDTADDTAGETAGDTASGRCELQELSVLADGSAKVLAGHYADTYRRTADGWRFTSRRLVRYYHGPPDLSAGFPAAGPTG